MTEKSLEKITSFSWDRDSEDMEEDSATMFDVFNSHMREVCAAAACHGGS